jgi:hypothetical protein
VADGWLRIQDDPLAVPEAGLVLPGG